MNTDELDELEDDELDDTHRPVCIPLTLNTIIKAFLKLLK